MNEDRRKQNNMASKPEQVAENAYFKIGTPLLLAGMLALIVFFLRDMHSDMKLGQIQINDNVTQIAINKDDINDIEEDITDIKLVNQRQWRTINDRPRN